MPTANGIHFAGDERFIRTLDYRLAGTAMHIVYDSGEEELYSFSTGEDLIRMKKGKTPDWLHYGSLTMRNTLRLIAYEEPDPLGYCCVTLVIDEDNGLVTRARTVFGGFPARPNLAKTDYTFGAVKRDGQELPWRRHCFTCDLTGKKIAWTYYNGFVNAHIYLDHFCRAQALRRPDGDDSPLIDDPIYEEPAVYVKIREGVYLMGVTEDNINRRNPAAGGSNLLLLMDIENLTDIGRNFLRVAPGKRVWGFIHAEGRIYTETLETETADSPNTI
ncbi:MAG: hypothetical protein IKH30_00765 [Clostridia bacterium]|nr:hypothetical protein [Clostridia bacterium]